MGFRDPLPVDAFVQGHAPLAEAFQRFVPPSPPLPPADSVLFAEPRRCHPGQDTVSTSLALESWPSVVWDVNGYYHALGVGFRATRRQLREAYQARGGPDDEWLTYVFRQLLDPVVRREYDSCPLGSRYLDRYVEDELKRAALRRAERMREAGFAVEARDVLRDWGFDLRDSSEEEAPEQIDIPKDAGEDKDVPSRNLGAQEDHWPYAIYGWRLRASELRLARPEVMRSWQEAVAAACQERGIRLSFGVGLMGSTQPGRLAILSVAGARVALISVNHLDSIPELAPLAAQQLLSVPA